MPIGITSVTEHENSQPAETLCIMAAAVRADRHSAGRAAQALTALRERAAGTGLRHVIGPVRPALKSQYPITSMESFARWIRKDGLHIDPWIRTHQRPCATILGPAPRAMTITGTAAEWEEWTEMAFPESGRHVVPDALKFMVAQTGVRDGGACRRRLLRVQTDRGEGRSNWG
ncbi:MAG: hypothetical protein ACTHKL_14600 [Streptosporangiaceae bacterium]